MIAGFDRYFQIAPCFRDEDARADRSPGEFYQLDIEMSFVEQEDVFQAVEPVLRDLFVEFGDGKPVTEVFPRIPYAEAMRKYGTDKPDLRNPIEMSDVTEHFRDSGFKVFAGQIAADPKVEVWAIPAPTGGNRAFCDRMNSWAQGEGQPGPRLHLLPRRRRGRRADRQEHRAGAHRGDPRELELKDGDAVFFVCGRPASIHAFAGSGAPEDRPRARTPRREPLRLLLDRRFPDVRVERGGEEDRLLPQPVLHAEHRPRRVPGARPGRQGDDPRRSRRSSTTSSATASSCRRARSGTTSRRSCARPSPSPATARTMLESEVRRHAAARSPYGAPPHGGIAPGIDRIVMLLCGEENLREVTLFPMNQRAEDLMMGAPSEVSAAAAPRAAHPARPAEVGRDQLAYCAGGVAGLAGELHRQRLQERERLGVRRRGSAASGDRRARKGRRRDRAGGRPDQRLDRRRQLRPEAPDRRGRSASTACRGRTARGTSPGRSSAAWPACRGRGRRSNCP